MNVVLPEFDGRIIAGAISFKGETPRNAALEFTRLVHQPVPDGILTRPIWRSPGPGCAARPERNGASLACCPTIPRRPAGPAMRSGSTRPRSVIAIAGRLAREGFAVEPPDDEATLIAALSAGEPRAVSERRRL